MIASIPKDILLKVDFKQVCFADKFWLQRLSDEKLDSTLKYLMKVTLHFKLNNFPLFKDLDWLCLRSLVRDDYKNLFHSVVSQVPGTVGVYEDFNAGFGDYNFEISQLVKEYRWILPLLRISSNRVKVGCYLRLVQYLYVLSSFGALGAKRLLVFADMQPVDNLAVQIYKLMGKPTVTLQHGLYVDYKEFDTVNVINYLHHCSDYFLAWGEVTKSLIQKFHKTNVVVCGKPVVHGLPLLDSSVISSQNCNILVVTDQKLFDNYNEKLLQMASKVARDTGKTLFVRFHPSNNVHYYKKIFPDLIQIYEVDEPLIVIGHTTSMIYEALTLGYPAFKLASSVYAVEFPADRTFSSADELKELICGSHQFNLKSTQYIDSIGEKSLKKYRVFFERIISDAYSK